MPLTDQQRTVRLPLPEGIVRGSDHIIYAPVYLDGEVQVCSSGTVSVYDASNTAIVSAAAVTVGSDGIAYYTVLGTTTTSLTLEVGWRIEWTLTMADNSTIDVRQTAALVLYELYPVVTDEDLIRRCPALDYDSATCITDRTHYQPYLDEAWLTIQRRLWRHGDRPNLIVNPDALGDPHKYLALALIFEDLSARDPMQSQSAELYRGLYRDCWEGEDAIQLEYATGDDEQAVDVRPATPTIFLCSRR